MLSRLFQLSTMLRKLLFKNLSFRLLFIKSCLLFWSTGPILANTYEIAERQYRSGDLIRSENSILTHLKQSMSAKSQADSLKLLGIIRFSRGDTNGAERRFKEALSLYASLRIDSSEVLDGGVIVLFEKIKKRVSQSNTKATVSSSMRGSGQGVVSRTNTLVQQNRTTLKIASNIVGAKVMIDGIYAGDSGYSLSADPGNLSFAVSAPGYQTYRGTARIVGGRETVLTVNLIKLPQSSAVVVAGQVPRQQVANAHGKTVHSPATSQNLTLKNRTSKVKVPPRSPRVRSQPLNRGQNFEDDLFAESSDQNPKESIVSRSVPNEFDRDLEAVRRRDAQVKQLKKQQRIRSRPPANYADTSFDQATHQVDSGMNSNLPEVQYESNRSSTESKQNSGPNRNSVNENSPGYFTPQAGMKPATTGQNGVVMPLSEPISDPAYKKSAVDDQPSLITLFPFGIGQISQNRYGIGSVLFVIQSGLLFYAFDKNSQADGKESSLQRFVDINCSIESNVSDDRYRRCLDTVDSDYKRIDALRNESSYAFAGLAVVALGGIIEAMNWEPSIKTFKRPLNRGLNKSQRQLNLRDSQSTLGDEPSLKIGLTTMAAKGQSSSYDLNSNGLGVMFDYRF